jgi:hypothetical protein
MIYFHDNDKIVYTTVHGIEKLYEIEKLQKRKKTTVTLKEIANIYYNKNCFARRFFYD